MPRLITSFSSSEFTDAMVYGWVATDSTSVSSAITKINLSTTNNALNGRFIVDGTNDTLKPLIAGRYMVWFNAGGNLIGSTGYSVVSYVRKNGTIERSTTGIRNYAGSSNADFPITMVALSMNGTSDTFDIAVYQNSGNTCTINAGSLFVLRVGV